MKMTRTKFFGIAYITIGVMLFTHHLANYMIKKESLIGQDDFIVFVIIPALLLSIWLFVGLFKLLSKKERYSSLLNMLVLFIMTAIFNIIFTQFTGVVIKSRAYSDAEHIKNIKQSIDLTLEEIVIDDTDYLKYNEHYQELLEGCDIATWGTPNDELSSNLAMRLGIADFSELKYGYYTVTTPAVVHVSLEDGKANVTLQDLP